MLFNNEVVNYTEQPLFFGEGMNVSRLDMDNEQWIANASERLRGKLWFPSDFDLSQAATDYNSMTPELQELFLKNLKFQTLLDSIATRSVLEMYLPVISNSEMEAWFVLHGFTESIHSLSYADIVKTLPVNAKVVFDEIMYNDNILTRAKEIIEVFEELYMYNCRMELNIDYDKGHHKFLFVKSLYALNILENVLFDSSFNTTFAFAENGMMDGPAKIVKKINADEQSHYSMTVYLINRLKKDNDFKYIFENNKDIFIGMYKRALEADYSWIDYTYTEDTRLLGINNKSMKLYSNYNIYNTMVGIGLEPIVDKIEDNPMSWLNSFKSLSTVQVAQKETSGTNYLLGRLNLTISEDEWKDL